MQMNVTAYKGITITAKDGRFYLSTGVGNSDGYPTMNHAKGAITRFLNQPGVPTPRPAKAATSDDTDKASVKAPSGPTGAYLPRDTVLAQHGGKIITAGDLEDFEAMVARSTAEMDNLLALLRYEGFLHTDGSPKQPDSRSRNKREGRYAGKWAGIHMRHPKARQPSAEAVNIVSDSRNSDM
jgi:hypothetical protein